MNVHARMGGGGGGKDAKQQKYSEALNEKKSRKVPVIAAERHNTDRNKNHAKKSDRGLYLTNVKSHDTLKKGVKPYYDSGCLILGGSKENNSKKNLCSWN